MKKFVSYAEKLKHPKWQKKRLEALEAAEFTCQYCGDKDSTLHVHHGYYAKGREPWEYEAESLHVLCAGCHEDSERWRASLYALIGRLSADEVRRLHGYALAIVCAQNGEEFPKLNDIEETYGIADWAGASQRLVERVLFHEERAVFPEELTKGFPPHSYVDDEMILSVTARMWCGLVAARGEMR